MNEISIIGSGGHTRSFISLLLDWRKDIDIKVYDDSYNASAQEEILGFPLHGPCRAINSEQQVFISCGSNKERKDYFVIYYPQLIKKNIVHSTAVLSEKIELGIANHIYSNVYLGPHVKIGDNNIINTGSIIEHETKIGSHNHISVGAVVAGRAVIGNQCMIGAGSVIIDKVSICDNVTIGAGSVVINDICEEGVWVGKPARKVK